jgi:2-desacetyl-2-hydroxyethyl bacteriochlorophyllide A dehydrogenase
MTPARSTAQWESVVGMTFNTVLGTLYRCIPRSAQPFFKSTYIRSEIRMRGLFTRRAIGKGRRVVFLDCEIADLEEFEYLGPSEYEVELTVSSSTVSSGTETAVLCGLPGARRSFPYFPGYSAAGRVTSAGSRVRGYQAGDRVAGRVRHVSHESVSTELIFRIPDGVTDEAAGFIELGVIALQGVRKSGIRPGDRVAVLGQGIVGQLVNRIAKLVGAGEVIALAASSKRAKPALANGGADRFIETGAAGFNPESIDADIVVEAVGTPGAISMAARCARRGGKVVLLGSSRGLSRNVDFAELVVTRGLELVGAHISNMPSVNASPGRFTYRQEGELFLELLRSGRLSVEELVTWRARPEDCNAVYEQLARGGAGHVAIVFDWTGKGSIT